LIRPQKFEGAPFESYDMMGWTLAYQFGVKITAANSPVTPNMSRMKELKLPAGKIRGKPHFAYLLSHETNVSFTAMNRILKQGGKVLWAKESFSAENDKFPAGTIIIPSSSVKKSFIENLAKELSLEITGLSEHPKTQVHDLKKVRIGMYKSWIPNADEGWTRLILEKYEFPYASIFDADIRAGNLNKNYDVIIMPDTWQPETVIKGHPKGTMPPQYVEGITLQGLRNLKIFAEKGGMIVFLNSVCNLPIKNFRLPIRNVLRKVSRDEFVCDGSILRMEFDTRHPVAYGMPKEAGTIFSNSCAFEIMPTFEEGNKPIWAAKYPAENPLMSGWIHGEKLIQQKSTIVEAPYGKGKIILLGFPVQFRAQPYGTFKLLFNSLLYAGAH